MKRHALFAAGMLVALSAIAAAPIYNYFSPGGALSGTATSQSVNLGSGAFITGVTPVANGGSGAATLTGYTKGNGTSPFTASASIPGSDITGAALTQANDTNVTLTLGGTPATAALRATSFTMGWTGNLAVGRGGLNLAATSDDGVPVGDSASAYTVRTLPNCPDSGGNHVNYTAATNLFSCGTTSSGGGGTPAGSTTQIQFNNAGAFGASADFAYTSGTNIVTLGSDATPGFLKSPITTNGNVLTIAGGDCSGSGNTCAGLFLRGGQTSVAQGNGGPITIRGGNGAGSNRSGGAISLSSGDGVGGGASGNIDIAPGSAGSAGSGGNITVTAGNAGATGSLGGNLTLAAGSAAGGTAGTIIFRVGATTIGSLDSAPQTGAQTATFTATNKPGSATGAPTNWLKFTQGGVTYWIPLFAN